MKSVLISIQPKWCELIASGKKTVEVRKTRPKLETPFKVYVYCTQGTLADLGIIGQTMYEKRMKVIGEFVCDRIDYIGWISTPAKLDWKNYYDKESCLTSSQLYDYSNGGCYYEWHISDLVIYDKPRELSEFKKPCTHKNDCCTCERYDYMWHRCYDDITRPFQSWGYVEVQG